MNGRLQRATGSNALRAVLTPIALAMAFLLAVVTAATAFYLGQAWWYGPPEGVVL